jgi:hypothetical protein
MKQSIRTNVKKSFKRKMGLGKIKTPLGMKIQKFAASGKGLGA